MTNEELNTALYVKMFEEQEKYRNWLLTQSPVEILNHVYEYLSREDILLSLEYHSLSNEQAKALLRSPAPLNDIFNDWEKRETAYMDEIWETVKSRATKMEKVLKEREER